MGLGRDGWRRWRCPVADDDVGMPDQCLENAPPSSATQLQRDGAFGRIEVEEYQAALGLRVIMGKRPLLSGGVTAGRFDFDDLRAELRQQLSTERTSDPLGELKGADTGERGKGDHAHIRALAATGEEFIEASRAAEKMFLPPNLASDRFGTREVEMAHGIPNHLLRDHRRSPALG